MTADWFKDAKMPSVTSFEDLKERCKNKKHLIIDYFSPNCHYCYTFMPDFNKIYDDLNERYGPEQIDIIKINGWEAPQLT
jgi:thiol-disulfide isomerase/thioredoxin